MNLKLEDILAEATRAINELPHATRGPARQQEDAESAATLIEKIATLIKNNESLPVYGLGGYEDNGRLWRVIAALALQQATQCELAVKRSRR